MNTSKVLHVPADEIHVEGFINVIGSRKEGANPVFTIRCGYEDTDETTFDVDMDLEHMQKLQRIIDNAILNAMGR